MMNIPFMPYCPTWYDAPLTRILAHITVHDIIWFLESSNLLAAVQHSFRKNCPSCTQLLATDTDWINIYDDSNVIDIAVLNFSKAFNVVSCPELLLKLYAIGLNTKTCGWIQNWCFVALYQRLLIDVNLRYLVTSGVPQSSALWPLLFFL